MKSDLLKEAIADAKAVRATALANAKAALEEAFNNRFSAVFADKLREDSANETLDTLNPVQEQPVDETVEPENATPSKNDGTKGWSAKNGDSAAKPTTKDATPNTIPTAKDGGDGTKGLSKNNKGNPFNGTPKGVKEGTNGKIEQEDAVEETITDTDLNEIIAELEAEAGEVSVDTPPTPADNAPSAPDAPPAGDDTIKSGDTVTITKTTTEPTPPEAPASPEGDSPEASTSPSGEMPPVEEEEIDLNELLANLNEEANEEGDDEEENEENNEKEKSDKCMKEGNEEVSALQTQLNEITSQRDEAYKTVSYLKDQINEINLLNAKLLYTNKMFKEFALNRDQKMKIVEAFDLTKNVREVKMTYANWCESLNFGGKLKKNAQSAHSQVTTITEGLASKPVASTKPEVITESVNDMAQRFKKLAGISGKK